MNRQQKIALVGNSLPRRCGIATFTTDLHHAIARSSSVKDAGIVAMTDHGHVYDYPPTVLFQVRDDRLEDYVRAAEFLNKSAFDIVSLQHEFGIFGGEAGGHILALMSRLTMPVVTTLHTVLEQPAPVYRHVLDQIVDASAKVIVMAEKARELLHGVYRVPHDKIEVIAHGIPAFPFVEPDDAKAQFGFGGRTVILTFGLLSPNKGIEVMIDAMPAIIASRPDVLYLVLGATHPNLVREQGEAYRDSLVARVRELAVEDHVLFLDRFVDQATLLAFIAACDVYVTPYLNEAQMTSGTLAYSFGLGKAVVSTPYWHAKELLAEERGILVPFGDAVSTGTEIAALLGDAPRLKLMRERAYASSRSMTWEKTAERYISVFAQARLPRHSRPVLRHVPLPAALPMADALPAMKVDHFLAMCDDTGLFQHAVHSVPDRSHGYCVDDNARALLVACALGAPGERSLPDALTTRFAAFIQHAWNPDTRRFRNFMSFDRRWLEDAGSEDSHGRTLWALGECARSDANPSRRRWATGLFAQALPGVSGFLSPRAWAFTLLGLDGYCAMQPEDLAAAGMRRLLADRLLALIEAVETQDWVWFEDGLAYDNARLCQALIMTGAALAVPAYLQAGLRSLHWLVALQTGAAGTFRPVGSQTFGDKRKPPRLFDQQALEATATISSCLAAFDADGDDGWTHEASRAFAWFLGENDLSVPLVDLETGSCRDGLHPDRANENRGGESVVSYLLSLAELRALRRDAGDLPLTAGLQALSA